MAAIDHRSSTPGSTPGRETELSRQVQLLTRLLLTMAVLTLVGAVSSLFDPNNDLLVTSGFYVVVWLWFGVVFVLTRHGRVTTATWLFAGFFWLLIACVTLLFGGMQGQNASTFAVCTLLVGSVVGGRAALVMAAASSAWCAFVAYLEVRHQLPAPLGPYSPINSWGTVTITVSLTTVLLHTSLQSLREAYANAQRTAAERDQALRKSIRSQKMELVGNLTSGIAHDLNNLLTVIVGATDVLRENVTDRDDDSRALVQDLDDAASRAALITRQLLAFGRAPADERQLIDASEIIAGLGRMLPRVLGSRVTVRLDVEPDCWLLGSRSGLEQIILNLAVNSRDAMPSGGTLTFELRGTGDQIVLLAQDTGEGIPESIRERMFEPFFTTKATGTGLGLSTIRRILDHLNGTISVESSSETGTTFCLTFPRAPAPSDVNATEVAPSIPHAGHPRLRILVVEDDPLVRHTLTRTLDRNRYDVLAVSNGVEALAVIDASQDVHCVVSDVAMPQMDGEELTRRLEVDYPELPMVLISGNRQPALSLLGEHRTFLRKPFSAKELEGAITRVTEAAGHDVLI